VVKLGCVFKILSACICGKKRLCPCRRSFPTQRLWT